MSYNRGKATYRLPNYFHPYFELAEFKIKDIQVKAYKKIGKKAKNAAKKGDLERAYALYKSIEREDSYNDIVHYNLGVIQLVVGNYAESLEEFETALKLKYDKDYKECVSHEVLK